MVRIDGLGEKIQRPFLHCRDRVLDAAEGRHHDDLELRVELPGGAQHAEAVAARQLEVGQYHCRPCLREVLDRFGLVARFQHNVPLRLERVTEHGSQ